MTGLGHGAAGFGWALLELYRTTGRRRFLEGSENAFQYERSLFRDPPGSWPDFRFNDGVSEPPPYGVVWCQGVSGIGLTRLRALEICPNAVLRNEVSAALRAVTARLSIGPLAEGDFSLCHGAAGMADFLVECGRILEDDTATALAHQVAVASATRYAANPATWPSGVPGKTGNPSLMLGLAGAGLLFLRLEDPGLRSILLPTPAHLS